MTSFSFLRSRAAMAGAALYVLVSLVCACVPLLNYLGFEFAFVLALVASFQASFLTISLAGKIYRLAEEDGARRHRAVVRAFGYSAGVNLLLLGLPLVLMLANAFFVRNCSLVQGMEFFLLLPVVSALFATCTGLFCVVHYRHARLAFTAIVAATFVYALALGYFTPAIFSFNPFYGYFPGLTYDEELGVTGTLVLFRLLTLACGAIFLWMGLIVARQSSHGDGVRVKGTALARQLTRGKNGAATLAILACAVTVFWFRCELGFESSEAYIRKVLGGELRTEHFDVIYAKGSCSEEEIRRIGAEHEFRLHQVLEALSLTEKGRITSFLYPSLEEKLRLIGAGNTDIAKPWRNEIHITRQSLEATLKHELVHVASARFGIPVIRVSMSTGLVEGLAMAVDWRWGNRTPHQYAAGIRRFGLTCDIRPLMKLTGFAAQSTALSYVLSGSFCRYLIDRYGIRKMMLLYGSGEYELLYGRSLDELNKEWQDFLDRIPVSENDHIAVEALFQRPTIFKKTCARVIARRNRTAQLLLRENDYAAAGMLFRESYNEGAGIEALSGWLTSELHEGHYDHPAHVLDTLLRTSPVPGQLYPLLLVEGEAWWGKGEFDSAGASFRRLAEADITNRLTESALLRIEALRDSGNRAQFLPFFLSARSDSLRVTLADSLLAFVPDARFLVEEKGESLLRLGCFDPALMTLQSLTWEGADERLEAQRLKNIGRALFRLRRFQEARVSFWLSMNAVSTPAATNEVDDWIERCDWMATHEF